MRLLWDFVKVNGRNDIQEWVEALSKADRIRLEHKLDYVAATEFSLVLKTKALAGVKHHGHIYKLRVMRESALRLMMCQGPIDMPGELTLLLGAEERDFKYVPRDAPALALERRDEVKKNPEQRRCKRESYSETPRRAAT